MIAMELAGVKGNQPGFREFLQVDFPRKAVFSPFCGKSRDCAGHRQTDSISFNRETLQHLRNFDFATGMRLARVLPRHLSVSDIDGSDTRGGKMKRNPYSLMALACCLLLAAGTAAAQDKGKGAA